MKSESLVAQLSPTLCDTMDCRLPGSSVHEIFQARVLEWVATSFSRGSSRPRDQTLVSHIVGRHFYRLSHQIRNACITINFSLRSVFFASHRFLESHISIFICLKVFSGFLFDFSIDPLFF